MEKDEVEFSALLSLSVLMEAVNEDTGINKIRNLVPKSEFEAELLGMLKKYPSDFSFAVYVYFEKIKNINFTNSKEDVHTFFIDMEIIFVLHSMIDKYSIAQEDVIKYLKGFSSLGKYYAKIVKNIYIFFSNKHKDGAPSKENILSYLKTFHSFSLGSEIKQAVREAYELKKEFYGDFFIEKNITDIKGVILEQASFVLETKFEQHDNLSNKPYLVSLNPPLWTNARMDRENIFTSFLVKKISDEAYEIIKAKNLFFYFLVKSQKAKNNYLSTKISQMLFTEDVLDKRAFSRLDELLDQGYKEKALSEVITYANISQLKDEDLQATIYESFSFQKNKEIDEEALINKLLGSIYKTAMTLAHDEQNFLFYEQNISQNKNIIIQMAEIIRDSMKRN